MSHWYPTHWKTGVVSGSDSTDYQCLTATRSTIRLLGLSGLANDSVVIRKLPLERIVRGSEAIAMPAVLLTPRPEIINPYAGTNVKDDIGYGVLVSILAEDNQEPTLAANLEKYLSWRRSIISAFRNQRLAGVPSVYTCHVEPGEVISPPAWLANLYVSGLVLRFIAREARG